MKSSFPYLVDLSVSTKCPYGCPMCYTSSLKKGIDADPDFLTGPLLEALFEAGVMNVVFGGGEPSLYPHLGRVLKAYKDKYFVTGVTTKNYNLDKIKNYKEIFKYCDSIAFSCHTLEDLAEIGTLMEREADRGSCLFSLYDYEDNPTVYLQNILGLTSFEELLIFIKTASEHGVSNITLLGYKTFGFGAQCEPHPLPKNWVKKLKKVVTENGINLGADSILINKYRDELLEVGVASQFLVGKEGESSCYIDAPRKRIQASSFTNNFVDIPENLNKDSFLDIFASF